MRRKNIRANFSHNMTPHNKIRVLKNGMVSHSIVVDGELIDDQFKLLRANILAHSKIIKYLARKYRK
jgi:uncharacterized membrane protein YjfL (UPF0719 family)